jgi:hypothetical protein
MHAIVIRNHKMELVTLAEGSNAIGEIIGGYIERAAVLKSVRPDIELDVWVDEEGLYSGATPNVLLASSIRIDGPYPINGPVVITAGDSNTGETIDLTAEEMALFRLWDDDATALVGAMMTGVTLPLLDYIGPQWNR